jgi:CheY-like chemotaxis protein
MPKLSGLDLLKSIKANQSLKHIEVFILSQATLHLILAIASIVVQLGYYVKPSTEQGIIDIAKEILSKVDFLGKEQLA